MSMHTEDGKEIVVVDHIYERGGISVSPITKAQLVAALIAEGGETIWWCEKHRAALLSTDRDSGEQFCWKHHMNFIPSKDLPYTRCHMVEKLLAPIPVESAEAKETPR